MTQPTTPTQATCTCGIDHAARRAARTAAQATAITAKGTPR